jgi:hypothetical protein
MSYFSLNVCIGGIFYDLGSGTGKAVIAAAMNHNFSACYGIEILESLYDSSVVVKEQWDKTQHITHVDFFFGSFLDMNVKDWTDGDVVFANSTCYNNDLMTKLSLIAGI